MCRVSDTEQKLDSDKKNISTKGYVLPEFTRMQVMQICSTIIAKKGAAQLASGQSPNLYTVAHP